MTKAMIRLALTPIWAIALNSFREAVRNRVLVAWFVLPVVLIGLVSLLGQMSLHNEVRVARNVGYFFTTVFSVGVTIYSTVVLFHTELERRTIYTLLSKPLHRWQFLLGKLLGVCAISLTSVMILTLVSALTVVAHGGSVDSEFAQAFILVFFVCCVVAAITIFFSTFSNPLISGLFSFGLFIAGNMAQEMEAAIKHFKGGNPLVVTILEIAHLMLPNFSSLNLSYEVTYSATIPPAYVLTSFWYSLSYSSIIFLGAVLMFERKTFQ